MAVNPGAYEDEAITALRRARALVKEDPELAYPEVQVPPPKPPPPDDAPSANFQPLSVPPANYYDQSLRRGIWAGIKKQD